MPCKHDWVVFSTALAEGWLMLQCVSCGMHGTVDDPSKKEWSDAYHAPSKPYRWKDESRVTIHSDRGRELYVESVNGEPVPSSKWAALQAKVKGEQS